MSPARYELEAAGNAMKAAFEMLLKCIPANSYKQPVWIEPSVEPMPRIGYFWERTFWEIRQRILLTVRLSSAKDLERLRPMIEACVGEYLSQNEHWRYRVRIYFAPILMRLSESERREEESA